MNLKRGNFLTKNNMNFNSKLAIKYPKYHPVEKEVVNWRVQVFANSTVNLHFLS